MAQAYLCYFVCFWCICHPGELQYKDGKDLGFWVGGHVVYGGTCIMCNVLILMRFNNFTGYGEALVALMLIAYFFIFWL